MEHSTKKHSQNLVAVTAHLQVARCPQGKNSLLQIFLY